jgi:hypothetical protein
LELGIFGSHNYNQSDEFYDVEMGRNRSAHGEKRKACSILVEKRKGIEIVVREVGWGVVDRNDLARDRDQ